MKADCIKEIIEQYEKLPYECILFDGPWGVGKSYAIDQALNNNNNVCYISMFGIKDAQEIYHEVFSQLAMKDKRKVSEVVSKLVDAGAGVSKEIAFAKNIISSFVKEKELFLNISKTFTKLHLIVIDDLERMQDSIKLKEVFGIIEELKRCYKVKVILVAHSAELSDVELFKKYSEKVIDRTYHITERSENVDWSKLNIHHGFITQFLSVHDVKNLRTLQKAQNLYDDVKLKLRDGYLDEFYDEIRLACFGIVVESIDNLYYKEPEKSQKDSVRQIVQNASNTLEFRINNYYLRGTRIGRNMVKLLKEYYENEIDLLEDEIEAEYQIFLHAGEKANYYKSDKELELALPRLADNIRQETNIAKLMRYADEYIIWSEHLQIDTKKILDEYKEKLHNMIFAEVMKGNTKYLTYGIESFHIQSQTNKKIVKELNETIKAETVKAYIKYLSLNTEGEQAYQYSCFLAGFGKNIFLKGIISENIDALYNEKSFPIHNVTEENYRTSYNIMHVLYYDNKDRFLAYCDELKNKCDHMAAHRIDVILNDLTENELIID